MNCFLLFTNHEKGKKYVEQYLEKNNIITSNIDFFDEKIGIDTVRTLRRTLSFKLRNDEKKVVVLNNEITLEAQNALLKCIEELSEQVILFIISDSHETILPTISSRCKIITLGVESKYLAGNKWNMNGSIWEQIERITEKNEASIDVFLDSFRQLLLSEKSSREEKLFAYEVLRKLQKLTSLVINNNVQLKIVIEKILLDYYLTKF